MFKEKLERLNDYELWLDKSVREGMNVDCRVIANDAIIDAIEDECIKQLTNVAMMPGIIEPAVALPDAHFGYGLPVGSAAAFDMEEGVISAGLCGFDINCGVNVIRTNLTRKDVLENSKELIDTLFKNIPCGVGGKGRLRVSQEQLEEVMTHGVSWAAENGYASERDAAAVEEGGVMQGADPKKVSEKARKRGVPQLGTLGAGNHFCEVQAVDALDNPVVAKSWGLKEKDQVAIMLHSGSRGFGHQIATDYLRVQENAVKKYKISLPDQQLACAPIQSSEGQDYLAAMKCAVNFAFVNRQVMTHWVRESFESVFKRDWESMDMELVYGICHNVVKEEDHMVEGEKRKVMVHRKGATRSFPDQPVLVAGSMGTASYICKGEQGAMEKTFGSSAHGAGRAMSRHGALRKWRGEEIQKELAARNINAKANHPKSLAEEAPLAYKDVDAVIESVHGANVSSKVARMVPLGVIKG